MEKLSLQLNRLLKSCGILFLAISLTGCPGEEDCNDIESTTKVDNLISITPLKEIYNKGENIIYKIEIPSENMYFNKVVNLYENTKDNNGFLLTSYSNLFLENNLNFVSGSQGSEINWFNVAYDPLTKNYNLEIEITLNKVGEYALYTNEYILFQGASECNFYRINTNISQTDNGKIEFTVE